MIMPYDKKMKQKLFYEIDHEISLNHFEKSSQTEEEKDDVENESKINFSSYCMDDNEQCHSSSSVPWNNHS